MSARAATRNLINKSIPAVIAWFSIMLVGFPMDSYMLTIRETLFTRKSK
jgi:hypothetical protein